RNAPFMVQYKKNKELVLFLLNFDNVLFTKLLTKSPSD
ncbi:MAG: hypothetical protein ACI9BG_000643, partial [Parasphingorhabdus sp.]